MVLPRQRAVEVPCSAPPSEDFLEDGELIELLDVYRVIAVGRIVVKEGVD